MNNLLFWTVLMLVLVLAFVMHRTVARRTWERRWQECLKQAREIVAGVKLQYPDCEGAMNAITLEPALRSASNLAFEDLMDVLDIFDPASTPLLTMCKTDAKLENSTADWEVDSYETPQGAIGPGDGYALQSTEIADVTGTRRKMGNGGQLIRQGFGSGWVAERVPKLPGSGKGVLASAYKKYLIKLKQTMECAFASFDQVYAADAGSSSGGLMSGLRNMVDPANKYANANSMVPGKPTDIHTAPAAACITGALANQGILSMVKIMMSALFDNVQKDRSYYWCVGKGLRQAISGLTDGQNIPGVPGSTTSQSRVFTRDQDDEMFKQKVSVIQTDFGTLEVMLDVFLGTTTTDVNGIVTATRANRVFLAQPNYGYVIPMEKLAKRYGFPIDEDELGHDGSGVTRYLFAYLTLVVYNPMGFGFQALT